jgi:hypothetical protein
VAAALSLCGPYALAQQEGRAESPFRDARAEMKRGTLRTLVRSFAESYRLDPSIGTRLNLGLCDEQLVQLASA